MVTEEPQKKKRSWGFLAGILTVLTVIFAGLFFFLLLKPKPIAPPSITIKVFPPRHSSDIEYTQGDKKIEPQRETPAYDTNLGPAPEDVRKDSRITFVHLGRGKFLAAWIDTLGNYQYAEWPFPDVDYGLHFALEKEKPAFDFYDWSTPPAGRKWWKVELDLTGGVLWDSVSSGFAKAAARFVIAPYKPGRPPFFEVLLPEVGFIYPSGPYVAGGIRVSF